MKGLGDGVRIRSTGRLLGVVAALGLTVAFVEAQRETAPAGVTNYTKVDATVACAGATPVTALPEIKKNGFASVVNFRMPTEQGANIDEAKATAAQVGLKYIHLPYQTPTPEIAEAFLKAVADPSNQPMYIHCASANRVGAMWFIKRVKLDGWDVDRAMKEAEGIGLRAPNLKEFALNYVGAKR
ncbi:MAG: hypothetical protein DMF89_00355 [Acidobacteria bacterium]|nr:MAG: hypothetical protein DMF89_00355 [Acidobacteriota bacterium]